MFKLTIKKLVIIITMCNKAYPELINKDLKKKCYYSRA